MKIGIMIWGVFLIVGAIADQSVVPNVMASVSDITGSVERNVISGLPVDIQASQSFNTADMNSGFDQMRLQLTSLEKYVQIGSISMGIIGVGLVTFGGLAKNKPKLKTADSPIEILKKRLAKGEITKMEFNSIKRDLQ